MRICIVLGAAIGLYFLVRLLLLLVPIKEITVAEGSFYTAEELSETADLEIGDRMYGFSGSRVKRGLKEAYPLIEKVKIKRTFGGTLTLIPVERESDFFISVAGNYYVLSREDFRILMETDDRERLAAHGYYEISLPDVRVAFIGETLEFGEAGKTGYLDTLLETLEASFLAGRITGIRAAEQFNLSVIVDGKYDITLGSISELDRKLEALARMMEEDIFLSGSPLEVNLTDLSAPTARAVEEINTNISGTRG